MKSIRSKILFLMIIISIVMGMAVVFLSSGVYENYKDLKVSSSREHIDFSTESINKKIMELRESARSIARCGFVFYNSEKRERRLAEKALMEHFEDGAVSVGGGIWYEPYSFEKNEKRACMYAFNDGGKLLLDDGFMSDGYDYHNQIWYVAIKSQVKKPGDVGWSPPYIDQEGTKTLMTTGGAGIYDESGKFVGMSTVDWELDAITTEVSNIRPTENSFTLFADVGNDYIIVLTDKRVTESHTGKSLRTLEWFNPRNDQETRFSYRGEKYISFRRMLDNGMVIVVNVPESELFAEVDETAENTMAALVISCFIMFALIYLTLNYLVNKPIAYLSSKASDIGAGKFDTKIFLDKEDEFGSLAHALNIMAKDIRARVLQLENITAEKQSIVGELDLAKEIQSAMTFSITPVESDAKGFSMCANKVMAEGAGGDMVDFIKVDANRVVIVASRVFERGIPASLFMMILRNTLKNLAQKGFEAKEILNRANRQLIENFGDKVRASVFVGVLDLQTGELSYANAGHNPPYVSHEGGDFFEIENTKELPLVSSRDTEYRQNSIFLERGDIVFLYTNGLLDMGNPKGERFGASRMISSLNDNKHKGVTEMLYNLRCSTSDFSEGAEIKDDIAMLALLYTGR